jgi:hypothetical protein
MIGSAAEALLEKIKSGQSLERADLRAQSCHARKREIVPFRP